jgi:hypothetical protein
MISLKELIGEFERGFKPVISIKDVGKYLVVYVKDKTVVKGTVPYKSHDIAQNMADYINSHQDQEGDMVKVVKITNRK